MTPNPLNCETLQQKTQEWWSSVPMGAPDAILDITLAYNSDTNSKKINLGTGAYRDDDGNPWVLPSVLKAEKVIRENGTDKEYAPIVGEPEFCRLVVELALGEDCKELKDGKIAISQGISGTGSLRLGCEFFKRFFPGNKEIWMADPTWYNHPVIAEHSGLIVKKYRYYDEKTCGLDFDGALEDISVTE